MIEKDLYKQMKTLRDLLLIFSGAAFVLLGTSFEQGITTQQTAAGFPMTALPITGWFGVWFILQIASLFFALLLAVGNGWKDMPFEEKTNLFFSYLAVGWVGFLAFVLRLAVILSSAWHIAAGLLGAVLLTAYLIVRSRQKKMLDVFP